MAATKSIPEQLDNKKWTVISQPPDIDSYVPVTDSALAILLSYHNQTTCYKSNIDSRRTAAHNFTVYLAWVACKRELNDLLGSNDMHALIQWTTFAIHARTTEADLLLYTSPEDDPTNWEETIQVWQYCQKYAMEQWCKHSERIIPEYMSNLVEPLGLTAPERLFANIDMSTNPMAQLHALERQLVYALLEPTLQPKLENQIGCKPYTTNELLCTTMTYVGNDEWIKTQQSLTTTVLRVMKIEPGEADAEKEQLTTAYQDMIKWCMDKSLSAYFQQKETQTTSARHLCLQQECNA